MLASSAAGLVIPRPALHLSRNLERSTTVPGSVGNLSIALDHVPGDPTYDETLRRAVMGDVTGFLVGAAIQRATYVNPQLAHASAEVKAAAAREVLNSSGVNVMDFLADDPVSGRTPHADVINLFLKPGTDPEKVIGQEPLF